MTNYADYLSRKIAVVSRPGIDVPLRADDYALFPHQRDLTAWALRRGSAAIFADTGLGKTRMRRMYRPGIVGMPTLAREFNCGLSTVRDIVTYATRR